MLIRAGSDLQRDYLRRECVDAFNDAARSVTDSLIAIRFFGPDDPAPTGRGAEGNGSVAATRDTRGPSAFHEASQSAEQTARPAAPSEHGRGRESEEPRVTADAYRHEPHAASESDLASAPGTLSLNPDYGFEHFVEGPTNRLALAAAQAVAVEPGTTYNPLFVHGGVGLGKTHLLHAICMRIQERRPGVTIHYISCDGFISDFMRSVREGKMADFRHRFRDVDVLVIDDIHFLSERDRTQEEFFHTFNSLYQSGRQIVLSSDAPPDAIPDIEERLVSRFNWGLVAQIQPPSYETRVAIIQAKGKLRSFEIPDDVACLIAQHIHRNIRELEGAVVKLQIYCAVERAPVDIHAARAILGTKETAAKRGLTLEEIITRICEHFSVRRSELLGKRRQQSISLPRQICMSLARSHTRHSLEEIGGHFGGRDHTTVMHAVRSIAARRETDPELDRIYRQLESEMLT